jgi:hypothetical protein
LHETTSARFRIFTESISYVLVGIGWVFHAKPDIYSQLILLIISPLITNPISKQQSTFRWGVSAKTNGTPVY